MALCVTEALPGEIQIMMAGNLKRLARRIARNREIAGLHYESDSQAGETLAKNTFNALQRSQLVRLSRAVEAAQKEWRQDDASSVTDKS
jgi:ATP-dependent protease HslVU (ClpYQ) peptidase subunit